MLLPYNRTVRVLFQSAVFEQVHAQIRQRSQSTDNVQNIQVKIASNIQNNNYYDSSAAGRAARQFH